MSGDSSLYAQFKRQMSESYDMPVSGWDPYGRPYIGNSPHMRKPEEIENMVPRSVARVRVFCTWKDEDIEAMQVVLTAICEGLFKMIQHQELAVPAENGWRILLIWSQSYIDDSPRG